MRRQLPRQLYQLDQNRPLTFSSPKTLLNRFYSISFPPFLSLFFTSNCNCNFFPFFKKTCFFQFISFIVPEFYSNPFNQSWRFPPWQKYPVLCSPSEPAALSADSFLFPTGKAKT